jgi:hypothetical protein
MADGQYSDIVGRRKKKKLIFIRKMKPGFAVTASMSVATRPKVVRLLFTRAQTANESILFLRSPIKARFGS